jgi:hypothetical protein
VTWLLAIPLGLLILAALYRDSGRGWRRGFVERVPRGRGALPMPEPSPGERVGRWRSAYDLLTIEQQIDNGSWPFVASAVSGLPRCRRMDPAELIGKTNQRGA